MAETDPFDNVLFFLSHNLDEEDRQELIPAIRVRFEEWWSSFDIDRKTVEQFAVKMVEVISFMSLIASSAKNTNDYELEGVILLVCYFDYEVR